ncbi:MULTISPECIES: energy-coupling factor transporter transmembrane component T [Corynebacterium]|uniref:energy-coupling factor transporter transmembrane component T n=1 Tax=Corynebacterium TaxID=1716 RepID=UPI00124E7AB3|nr:MULTISPECIES: energy-coupling factor transporter transmembrane component T [Corynebacterium]
MTPIPEPRPLSRPDPRTVLLTLITINALALGATTRTVEIAAAVVVFTALATLRRPKPFFGFLIFWLFFIFGYELIINAGASTTLALLSGIGYWLSRFGLVIAAAYWAVSSIRPTELIDALKRLHAPNFLVVPLAVVFRMFPVIATEARAVVDAMTLRGIRPTGWSMMAHPLRTAELIVIPLLTTVVRAGDELAAAAMIRGLGGPRKPTSIMQPRFRPVDAVLIVAVIALIILAQSDWELPL